MKETKDKDKDQQKESWSLLGYPAGTWYLDYLYLSKLDTSPK